MNHEELNKLIDEAINVYAEQIDIKELSGNVLEAVRISPEDAKNLAREKIEQKARTRIARIKRVDDVRDFFATPVDRKHGVYVNAVKSKDADALEKAAETIRIKMTGMQASHDKLMSQVFKLRHNVEIKDDGTLDTKTPYDG